MLDEKQRAVAELIAKVRQTIGTEYIVIIYGTGFNSTMQTSGLGRFALSAVLRQQASDVDSGRCQFFAETPTQQSPGDNSPALPTAAARPIALLNDGI